MPTLQCGTFLVWFGTDDAPAPSGTIPCAPELKVRVGILPEDPLLRVRIRYRRRNGTWMTLPAEPLPRGGTETPRYYEAIFRGLASGTVIEYTAECLKSGMVVAPKQTQTLIFNLQSPIPEAARTTGQDPSKGPEAAAKGSAATTLANPSAPSANTQTPSSASGSTYAAARLAGLSGEIASRLAKGSPNAMLLDRNATNIMVADGTIAEADADKLGVARIALGISSGNETAAGNLLNVLAAHGVRKPQDLAALTTEDIAAALESAGVADKNVSNGHAANIRAVVAKGFPSETLSPSKVAAPMTRTSTVSNGVIAQAWKNNAGIDIMRLDVSKDSSGRKGLNLAGLGADARKAFIQDIQLRRSVLIAGENPVIAQSLLEKGTANPGAVSPASLAEKNGISIAQATNIHERDIKHYGQLSHALFGLIDAYSGGLQNTAVGNLRRTKVVDFMFRTDAGEKFEGLDNMQELFGSLDSCDCKPCNSILGPAAYFVDLMHFVETHVLNEEVAEGLPPFKGKQQHRLHLRTRRPDLWVMALTCDNTLSEIPQLQITSEIIEDFLATKRGIALAPDRAAVVSTVYGTILPGGRHSVLQPFHLPIEELNIYLGHFNTRRSDIAQLLGEPEEIQLRAALGISKIHADLITTPDPSPVNIQNKLHLQVPVEGIVPIKELLTATQLPRRELGEVLQSRFVGGLQPLSIVPEKKSAESVQFDIEKVHGVTLGHLDRVHRFLRLRRCLPWQPQELDGFIAAGNGNLDNAVLMDAARAAILKNRFRGGAQELCALAGDLPEFPIERARSEADKGRSPFDILFNVPDLVREDGSYPDPWKRFNAGETSSAQLERALRLRAGLRVDEAGLSALVTSLAEAFQEATPPNPASAMDRFFTMRLRNTAQPKMPAMAPPLDPRPLPVVGQPIGSFPLSRHNLSLLVRHAVLARWLKLSIEDLLTCVRLAPGVGNVVLDLSGAVALIRFVDWWKDTRLSIEDLSILLAPAEAVREQIKDLWTALQAWIKEQGQDQVSFTDTFLTQVEGVSEDLSRELVALNTGKMFEAAGERFRVIPTAKKEDLDVSPVKEKGVDVDAIHSIVRGYHPDERLPRALTYALEMDINLARVVVVVALGSAGGVSSECYLQEAALSEKVIPGLLAILRLHRLGSALRLSPLVLTFVAEHQAHFDIVDWVTPKPETLFRIAATQGLMRSKFRDEPSPALSQIGRVISDRKYLAEAAVALFGVDPSLARDLVGSVRMPDNIIDAIFKLEKYSAIANKIGVDAKALANIVSEDLALAASASAAVMAGLRSKYPDETAWIKKVEPYQEMVLERKRDALIDFMLHGPDASFPDATEIYKYFLIDPEVDGCFRTSRIVAANASLQLYVHRILMNLERDALDGLHVLPSLIPDEEWEWRQHYRVWEANRKIFLWPENYLDPTIRDNKTPLFEDLESELLQQEISEQTVIDAYSNYLKQMEELANLRYAGAYHYYDENEESKKVTDIIYFFGATGGDSPTHYWREIRDFARSQDDELVSPEFGPWRKVETRIPVRHVSPVVFDGRLHVFWNEIATTPQNAVNDGQSRFVGYSHRYGLKCTSLRLDGQWTPAENISPRGASPTFLETENAVDDPLAEKKEMDDYFKAWFATFMPWFGVYHDPGINIDEAKRDILVPRWGIDLHTKAREGYGLGGFMWERPYLELDPAYGHRLLINCAGFLVRGTVDLFDRSVLAASDSLYKVSPIVESAFLAYRRALLSWAGAWHGGLKIIEGLPDLSLLRRDSNSLSQITWAACPLDYSVASALALNARDLTVFERHWGGPPEWPASGEKVANVPPEAGVWAVAGSPGETVIETEDEIFLLQPSASVAGHYVLYRMGTTLVRDISRKLFSEGLDELLSITHQLGLSEPEPTVTGPRTHDGTVPNPMANNASFGIYYQEIFQHIPLLIAYNLNVQGKFEHAQRWYHYVFNPTSPEPPTEANAPETDRNWKYRQFRGQERARLRDTLTDTTAIQKYREDPFNAHAIARLRVTAYQKAVVMSYIDNLLDWADDCFTRFQMETVNEAMMLYVTAAEVLGPRPFQLGECGEMGGRQRSYEKLKGAIGKDGEFLIEVEQLIPRPVSVVPATAGSAPLNPVFGLKGILAFPLSVAASTTTRSESTAKAGGSAVTPPENFAGERGVFGTGMESSGIGVGARLGGWIGTESASGSAVKSATATLGISAPVMGAIRDATKVATAAKESKGTTGITFAGVSSTATGPAHAGIGSAASTTMQTGPVVGGGFVAGSTTFTKVGIAMARTQDLISSFSVRQQFRLLGGGWKLNAGRRVLPTLGDRFARGVIRQVSAAFCIPRNEMLEEYWNRVEDRIRKIRTCRDITGRKRALSLFAPPIDPLLLARAKAAGISLDDALGAFDGTIPVHRFPYLLQKAKEFAGTVQSFGGALQAALERKDSEELVRIQANQQQQILALTTRAKEWELDSARANLESNERRRAAVEKRRAHYAALMEAGLNEWEVTEAVSTHTASVLSGAASVLEFVSAVLHLIPQAGSPFAMKYGGLETGTSVDMVHGGIRALAEVSRSVAASASLEARNDRRREDWEFQRDQSTDELSQIEKQIEAAEIACSLAEYAVKTHEKNIKHNEELLEYHEGKFSGLGLYTWLASQLQRTYREAYNMAYRMARYAEQAYRFEREDYTNELLSGDYWDASHAGLLAGNRLTLDLQFLEQRYIDTDIPKRELVDHVFSLRQWDPHALIELRQKGECKFKVPELFFDLASPGDYRRRLRSVRVTIPAVAGPYVNIMATLSLDGSQMRYEPDQDMQDAPRPRLNSISTSSARNDSGAFELNFRGEKYVPFEGAGAVSAWSLALPVAVRMFEYNTIADLLLHLDYTASFDGSYRDVVQGMTAGIVASVQDRLADEGITRAFLLNEEFPGQHHRLVMGETAEIEITSDHLPFFLRSARAKEAALAFTNIPEDAKGIARIECNGMSLGSPTADENIQGLSVALTASGNGPWKFRLLVADLPMAAKVWLTMKFTRE
jgi:hypothetical protein